MNIYTAKIQYGMRYLYRRVYMDTLSDAINYFKAELLPGEILVQVKNLDDVSGQDNSELLNYAKPNPKHVLEI